MHILLTDMLTCPRCGPDFGLVVLSDRTAERQVVEGFLGCANCRSSYPIREGVADLRHPVCGDLAPAAAATPDPDRAVRIAALLGVTRPNTTVLILEHGGVAAAGVSPLVPEVHVIGATTEDSTHPDDPGLGIMSRVRLASCVPFRSGSLSGVAVVGMDVRNLLPEFLRILRPDGRLVVEDGSGDLPATLREAGFEVHLEQDGVVVASPLGRS